MGYPSELRHPSRTRLSLALSAVVLVLTIPSVSMAQTPPIGEASSTTPTSKEPVEEVVVTGSNIRGVAPVGSDISVVNVDDLVRSGAVTTTQALQQLPQVFNLGVSENSRGQAGGAGNITYGSSINLRGISPYATLTLLNGHRAVQQGTSGFAIDPSIIPMLALERVDIVADGASAVYGSDAVAGVANLILKRNVEGGHVYVRGGWGSNYGESQFGAQYGHGWANGQITATFENAFHSSLSGLERDFYTGNLTAQGGGDFRSTQCNPGNIVISGVNYAIPSGGVTAANANALIANTTNKCDNLKYADLLPRQQHNTFALTFDEKINDDIKVYGDAFVARRDFVFNPGILSSNLTVPSTNAFYVRPPGAPAGTSETVAYSFLNQLPLNQSRGFSKSYEGTIAADIRLFADWKATIDYTYGRSEDYSASAGGLFTPALTAALASSNPSTALNVFGSGPNSASVLAGISNAIFQAPGVNYFQNSEAKVDGPIYTLPGGEIRAAVGVENQRITTVGGTTTGSPNAPAVVVVASARTINSAFVELNVPIVGSGNAMPGIRRLNVDIAGRYDKYGDIGSTTNPKYGISWSPVDELTVRGSYGTSFRAPLLSQIKGNSQALFVQNYSDPTLGGALRTGVALSGGNPNLKPEKATTYSAGIDWEPSMWANSKVSLTYFDIDYENQITNYLADLTILNREPQFAGTNIIQRNPSAALVSQLIATYPIGGGILPATWTLFVDGRNQNLGTTIAKGLDFSLSKRVPTDAFGNFGFTLSGTYFTQYKVAITQAAPLTDQLNVIFNPIKFKARAGITWRQGPFDTSVFANYENPYDNNLATSVQRVASYTTFDLRIAYMLDNLTSSSWLKGSTISLIVNNAFDRQPPFVNIAQSANGGGGFDPTLTNPVGRITSIALEKEF